jgi:phosphomevalonate kinase
MISGEYAVLEGAPALVAAAVARAQVLLWPRGSDRSHASGAGSPEAATLPPEAVLARRCAEQVYGAVPDMELAIDTHALRSGERKFGLGSSSAVAAGVVAAVAAAHGEDPADPAVRARLLPLAFEGHRAVAPEGSGADVAASMIGGFVRFRREPGGSARDIEASRLTWPTSLVLALLWTGRPARTSDLIRAVHHLAARDPTAYRRAMAPLAEAASALLAAIERGEAGAAIEAAAAHAAAMERLGKAAGAAIVTPELARAAHLAREVGGASKPSGAGGGDVALAFLPSEAARAELERRCPAAGLTLLPLGLGDDGPRLER